MNDIIIHIILCVTQGIDKRGKNGKQKSKSSHIDVYFIYVIYLPGFSAGIGIGGRFVYCQQFVDPIESGQ
ncbi:MAG TPA: hypothetical protein PLI19_01380 [Erysipelotrichaceae bacterium]|nr:hypothetical protein [Erysipelotrichaceae bacterium]